MGRLDDEPVENSVGPLLLTGVSAAPTPIVAPLPEIDVGPAIAASVPTLAMLRSVTTRGEAMYGMKAYR